MKKLCVIFLMALLPFSVLAGGIEIETSLGVAIPTEKRFEAGPDVTAGAGYAFNDAYKLSLNGRYYSYSGDMDVRVYGLELSGTYSPDYFKGAYLKAGIGGYHNYAKYDGDDDTNGTVGGFAQVGYLYDLNDSFSIGGNGRYLYNKNKVEFTDGSDSVSNFGGFGLALEGIYKF